MPVNLGGSKHRRQYRLTASFIALATASVACTSGDTGTNDPGINNAGAANNAGVINNAGVASSVCAGPLSEAVRLDVCFHFEKEQSSALLSPPQNHRHYQITNSGAQSVELSSLAGGIPNGVVGVFSNHPLILTFASTTQGASQVGAATFPPTDLQGKLCGLQYSYFVPVDSQSAPQLSIAPATPQITSVLFENVTQDCQFSQGVPR